MIVDVICRYSSGVRKADRGRYRVRVCIVLCCIVEEEADEDLSSKAPVVGTPVVEAPVVEAPVVEAPETNSSRL